MNKVKKIRMISMMMLFVFVMAFLPIQTEAKDKICINQTKISLNVGQAKKLSLLKNRKNIIKRVKWTSTNSKKVSINKKGVIRARQTGSAKVIAKYKGKKYFCNVIVKAKKSSETSLPQTSKDTKRISFRNDSLLNEHFQKHGIQMGFSNAKSYEQAAVAVVTNSNALHKFEAEDNDDVYYLESTNEFVIVSTDGYIRTYFKPEKGKEYFDRQ